MLMNWILAAMLAASLLYGTWAGTLENVSAAAAEGAGSAVTLILGLAGAMALWSAVLEVLRRSGLTEALSRLLRPLLRRLYPRAFQNPRIAEAVTANFTANLLGLGNAATPAGIRAARGMAALSPPLRGAEDRSAAGDELCRLVVMNTASVQLFPATVAALRSSLGSIAPLDILPCVWLSSLCSVCAGLLCAKGLERLTAPGRVSRLRGRG